MTNQTANENYPALLARLQKLEGENRNMKRFGALVVVAIAVLILTGQAGKNRALDADSLTIRDSNGRIRLELRAGDDGAPNLRMFGGTDKNPSVVLSSNQEKSQLAFFYGGFSKPSMNLSSYQDGPGLMLINPAGGFIMLSSSGPSFLLGGTGGGTSIRPASVNIFDDDKFNGFLGRTDTVNPKTGATVQTSAASLTLVGKDGKVIWQAP
jgi:hypothetical protein